ncbi:hypothetical protein HPB47_005626, partial [Ixodes persulcatus]
MHNGKTWNLLRHLLDETKTKRRILDDLGIGGSNKVERKLPVPEEVRRQTRIDPIPKNMNPDYNKGRRAARAKALLDLHANDEHACGCHRGVDRRHKDGSEREKRWGGTSGGDCHTVLSDSRQAVRNFTKGQICREAERVLRAVKLQDRKVRIKWFLAHAASIPPRLEAAAKSYDQDQQLWAVQQVLGALERQGPSEPTTASGDPRRVTATPKT